MPQTKITQFASPGALARTAAAEVLETLPGGTGAIAVRATDGYRYAVKLSTNPYGPRVLANELMASRLVSMLGLPTPQIALIEMPGGSAAPGPHFASRIARRRTADNLPRVPSTIWNLLQNPNDLWGAYVFDLWTGNTDTRQYLLSREGGTRPYRVVLFDHGHCFGGPTWRFLDSSVSPDPALLSYARVSGWNDLEPWLMRLESVSPASVAGLREGIPPSWLGATGFRNLGGLLATLIARRAAVRRFVAQRVRGGAQPFSTWRVCRDGHWRPSQWLRHSNVA